MNTEYKFHKGTSRKQVYTIHQIYLSHNSQIQLELEGWEKAKSNPEIAAFMAMPGGSPSFKPEHWQFYKPALKVAADSLNEVFDAGNGYGPDGAIIEKINPAYSCSVGDIIQSGGAFWMVDKAGFADVTDAVMRGKELSNGSVSFEQNAKDHGWVEQGIGFLVHPNTEKGIYLDFNGTSKRCYFVMKVGCSEVWDVLFSYADLQAKYIKPA